MHRNIKSKVNFIKEIIVINDEKCGAYKLFFPDMKPEEEFHYHVR